MRRVFFTADHHFGHENIIRFCNRPFRSTNEMDETMIAAWNEEVGVDDVVYYVGDFAYGAHPQRVKSIFERLHGEKHLIFGSHDNNPIVTLPWANPPQMMRIVHIEKQMVVLCHYAMRTWPGVRRGAIHLYGHSHGRLPGIGNSTDVGVDCWDFRPVDLVTIKARLETQPAFDEGDAEVRPSPTPGPSQSR